MTRLQCIIRGLKVNGKVMIRSQNVRGERKKGQCQAVDSALVFQEGVRSWWQGMEEVVDGTEKLYGLFASIFGAKNEVEVAACAEDSATG